MDILIGLARRKDAPAIAQMARTLIEVGLPWSWNERRIARCLADPDCVVLTAQHDGQIAGFAIMRYGDEDAHLDLLAVTPPHRRAGVGSQLLQWLEQCAVVAGITRVALEVRAGNEGARLFYERMGYRILVHLSGYYQGREAAVRMGRDLSRLSTDHDSQGGQRKLFQAEKIFERILGVLPGYLGNLSITRHP